MIKSESIPVLVPCDDTAREYISVLTGGSSVREKAYALKRCGDYTVNLFEYELKRLQEKNAVNFVEEVGVWVLSEGFYNNEYGVVIDGELEFCDL